MSGDIAQGVRAVLLNPEESARGLITETDFIPRQVVLRFDRQVCDRPLALCICVGGAELDRIFGRNVDVHVIFVVGHCESPTLEEMIRQRTRQDKKNLIVTGKSGVRWYQALRRVSSGSA